MNYLIIIIELIKKNYILNFKLKLFYMHLFFYFLTHK